MFDTYVTLVGNVLTAPEWRRTKNTGSLVANFKVASTARRLDRESGQWVDGNSFRVRVSCWRKLAEGVAASVITGDPVIVVGRLYTRDWTDENNNHRVGYELEAVAVGHDLSRGIARFARNRPVTVTSTVEDGQETAQVGGQPTEAVPMSQAPARRDGFFDELSDGLPASPFSRGGFDPLSSAGRGFSPVPVGAAGHSVPGADDPGDEGLDGDDPEDGLGGDDLTGDSLDGDEVDSDDPGDDDRGTGTADERWEGSDAGQEHSDRGRRERIPVPV